VPRLHAIKDCPACVLHIEDVQPYSDPDNGDVKCSRCYDEKKIIESEREDDHE
jgi:hypothetical protein